MPGPFGDYLRRHFYGRYFGHKEFLIRDNVFMDGYENNISLGKNVIINPNVLIFSSEGKLSIGNDVFINWNCFLSSDRSEIILGDSCLLGNNVTIWCSNHDYKDRDKPIRYQKRLMKPVRIGRDVWIGAQTTLLPGATIGDGCVVGAGSVVTKSFPPYTVLAGVPAKSIKKR